jgi:hypothetical protein
MRRSMLVAVLLLWTALPVSGPDATHAASPSLRIDQKDPIAEFLAMQRRAFSGLPGVRVTIDTRELFDTNLLQAKAERRLASKGIRVLQSSEWRSHPVAVLSIRLKAFSLAGSVTVFAEAAFEQQVKLVRDPAVEVLAKTWVSEGEMSSCGISFVNQAAVSAVEAEVDKFAAEFLAANKAR